MSDTEEPVQEAVSVREANQQLPFVYVNDLSGVKPPSFDWETDDLPLTFKKFRRYCELILSTPSFSKRSGHEIVSYILLWMGPRGVEIYDNWKHLTEAKKQQPKEVWESFATYFEPKSNYRLARFQLRDMKQQEGESADEFLTRLTAQAHKCHFSNNDIVDDNILDQVIKGTLHDHVRKRFLDTDPTQLTLDSAMNIARTYEATAQQILKLNKPAPIHAVQRKPRQDAASTSTPAPTNTCGKCGGDPHDKSNCPARGSRCNYCKKIGHWIQVCRKRAKRQTKKFDQQSGSHRWKATQKQPNRRINAVQNDTDDLQHGFETLDFHGVNCNAIRSEAFARIQIQPYHGRQTNLNGKVDSGAQGNILPLRTYTQIYPNYINSDGSPTKTAACKDNLTAYNGSQIHHYGTMSLPCKYNDGKWVNTTFYVADTPGPVIFGLPTCTALGLLKLNCSVTLDTPTKPKHIHSADDLKDLYPDCFEGLGKFPEPCRLTLKDDAQPVAHPPRRVPVQLRRDIETELDRMIKLDVIRPVSEPTEWVSHVTYVRKSDGSLRLCLDPKNLNENLKRRQHHIPTLEEIGHKFSGATVFSKLDARSGYWCVELEEQSQLLTTFHTHRGRHCFKRLPFGLNVSQDVFQSAMDQILEGLPGVISIADDIAVVGTSQEDHDRNLHALMIRAREKGLVFNYEKCKIKTDEITFFGNVYNAEGVHPDPAKVQAIQDIATPSNASQLKSFLGLITYLSSYIPHLSEQTASLRMLLRQDAEFDWLPCHQKAFENLKRIIENASALSFFDPKKPVVLQADASKEALGAALLQDNRVIAFASKSLTDTEKRYANIEREMLACVFAAERFHCYVFGKPFVIESDHKPLEMIALKNLSAAPARLQRMLLRLQQYDYRIQYCPGSQMTLADSLSRMRTSTKGDEIKLAVNVNYVQFAKPRLEELREETENDDSLRKLKQCIITGFPDHRKDIHQDIRAYWPFRDELCIDDGLVIKGSQIVVPTSLRNRFLADLHEGHQGITRTQRRAKTCIYWPNINNDIEALVSQCHICQKHQPAQSKEPLMPIVPNVPNITWHTIGTDLFTIHGHDFLIIADYHSKFPVVERLPKDTSSNTVASITAKIFSMFGVPNVIISDNGPQFTGQAYRQLMQKYGISHVTSSPHHSQSHGFIERTIRTIKSLMNKSASNYYHALLLHRTTPLGPDLPSPAELMFNRPVPSNLPIRVLGKMTEEGRTRLMNSHEQSSERYNMHSRSLQDLDMNQNIYYRDQAKKQWIPGKIVGTGPQPRSYTLQCEETGRTLQRNRTMLKDRSANIPEPANVDLPNTTLTPNEPTRDIPQTPVKQKEIKEHCPTSTGYRRSGRISKPPQRLIENV